MCEMISRIAMLGGFLVRKGDGEPGVTTLRFASRGSETS
ncbi:MAG: IS4 family transposase [Candidatus Accumulibacter sp. UW25]